MATNGNGHLEAKGLTTGWLATRLGIGSARVDVMRRSGELLGVRRPGGQDYIYPSWQFGLDGRVLPIVQRAIAEGRARGLADDRLYEVLTMRVGLGSDRRVVDLLREGDEEGVLRAIRSAA